jgi:4-amino-4-deoxy-L-arabinose transferase-like glycosyltransferase
LSPVIVKSDRFMLLALAAAVVGGVHGFVYVPFAGHVLGDTPTYTAPAQALLSGSYSTPLPKVDVTGLRIPTSARGALERQTYRTPGYPLLLAGVGGGTTQRSIDVVIAVQAMLSGLTVLLLALVFRRLWNERVALLGAYLAALDPFTKHYVTRILTEVLAGVLVAAAAYAFVRAWQSRGIAAWAVFGALGAALALTRPLFVFALPLAVLGLALRRIPLRDRLRAIAATVAAAAVLLAPWLAWTSAATGRPMMQSFGEGWNLLLAAHGEGLRRTAVEVQASPAFRRDFDSVHRFAPSADALRRDPDAHPRYLVRADAQQRDRAFDLYETRLRNDPLDVIGETAYRAYFLWMAHEDWRQPGGLPLLGLRLLDWLTLLIVGAGVIAALRLGGAGRALAIFLLTFTAVNAVHHVEARYAMPVRELALGYAAFALAAAVGAARALVASPVSRAAG